MGSNKETMFDESMQEDVVETFQQIKDDLQDPDVQKIAQKARAVINKKLDEDHTEDIEKGLQIGLELCEKIESDNSLPDDDRNNIISGLKYLNDPWDLIPDFISQDGMKDDAYILKHVKELNTETTTEESQNKVADKIDLDKDLIINELCGACGPHFAKRFKEGSILSAYERKALFEIGKSKMYGNELSDKQANFYSTIIKKLIKQNPLDVLCKKDCEKCLKFKQHTKNLLGVFHKNDIVEGPNKNRGKVVSVENNQLEVKVSNETEYWKADNCEFIKKGRNTY